MQVEGGPLSARQLRLVLGGLAIDAELYAEALVLAHQPDGETRFQSPRLTLGSVDVRRDTIALHASLLQAEGISGQIAGGRLSQLSATAIALDDVVIKLPVASVSIDRVTLPAGAALRVGRVAIPAIELGAVTVEIPSLRALARGGGDGPGRDAVRAALSPLLDRLTGQLHVDLDLAMMLPVIGRRAATHQFRIAIDGGAVDFGAVEDDLAALEDSVIDIIVDGDRLVIRKDVPLIPFDTKHLLTWPLDERARELARTGRVALSTLLGWEVPPRDPAAKPSKFALLGVAARDADIRLDVAGGGELPVGGGTVKLGDAEHAGVRQLAITGSISHVPGEPGPGQAELAWQEIRGALAGLIVGAVRIAASELVVGTATGKAAFEGLVPARLAATVERIAARDLIVTLAPA